MMLDSHTFDDQVVVPRLLNKVGAANAELLQTYFSAPNLDISLYDRYVIFLSGGKDSIASLLRLVELGVDLNRVELWHHDIDGREGSNLMDWSFMVDYNRKLAEHWGLPLLFSWLENGFEGEMNKENSFSHAHKVETPNGLITLERDHKRAKPGTRRRFPQMSRDLSTRWCSSALKIDVARRALNNQTRFEGQNTLVISGERRLESSGRAKYNQFEPHHSDRRNGRKRRHIDVWRPVLEWSEEQVWEIIAKHGIVAPVPYRLGWSRSSCMKCIFNDAVIWATLKEYFPGSLDRIAEYEREFGSTINIERIPVLDVANSARPLMIEDSEALEQAFRREFSLPITCDPKQWVLPPGAFSKRASGST